LFPKKDEFTLGVIFGHFLTSYVHDLLPSSPIDYEPPMLSMAETSATYATKSLTCTYSTCHFIKLVPKDFLYAMIFFPLLFYFQSKQEGKHMGNKYCILIVVLS
jgi:hypothetical protein